jgi:outer membrane biosynthesis protein TonB
MVDVVICCASADRAAAGRIADAVAGTGYEPWLSDASSTYSEREDEVTERIGAAKAAIVIWSKASRASTSLRSEARAARSQRKLIEVSIDGSKPMPPFDPEQLISLSGWRGQDGHPGWRSIVRQLERLCGAAPAPASAPAADPAPRTPRRGLRAGLAAVLIMSGLAAAAMVWREAGPAPDAQTEAAPPAPPPAPRKAVVPTPPPPLPPPPPQAAPAPEPQIPDPEPIQEAAPKVDEEAPAKSSKAAAKPREERPRERSAAAEAPRVKYRYSANMRAFCQKAGRSTRECRAFRRNSATRPSRASRPAPPPLPVRGPPS